MKYIIYLIIVIVLLSIAITISKINFTKPSTPEIKRIPEQKVEVPPPYPPSIANNEEVPKPALP